MAPDRQFVVERKLIIDESGTDVPAGHSTWHRVEALGPAEAVAVFAAETNAQILGAVTHRADTATAIVEIAQRAYRLFVCRARRP